MRLVLRAGFDRYSGYGNDGIDLAVNLEKAGVDVLPWPLGVLPGLPRSFTRLLEKDPNGPKDVVMTFAPPYDVRPWEFSWMAPKAVGYSMWERTPLLVDDFAGHGWGSDPLDDRMDRGRAWEGLDHMFVTCPMNVEAFQAVDGTTPLSVVPCGIEPEDWPVTPRDPSRPLTFLMIGMLNGRKDPFALLETWQALKADHPEFDARLHLHTLTPGLHPGVVDAYGPDVTLTERPLDRAGLIALYQSADVLVSTSRGEGNNKPAMEFMATGGTVVATDWSGHQNWLHRDVGYPLAGTLTPCAGQPKAQEFVVDRQGLADTLLRCWERRAEVTRKGDLAARFIRQTHSWPVVVERMIRTLEAL